MAEENLAKIQPQAEIEICLLARKARTAVGADRVADTARQVKKACFAPASENVDPFGFNTTSRTNNIDRKTA